MIVSFSYLEGNYKKDELNLFCVTPEDSMKGHWVKVMGSIFQLNRKKDFLIISSVLKWNEIPQKSNHHSRWDIQQTPYAGGPRERFLLPAGDWTKWPLRISLLLKVYDSLSCFLLHALMLPSDYLGSGQPTQYRISDQTFRCALLLSASRQDNLAALSKPVMCGSWWCTWIFLCLRFIWLLYKQLSYSHFPFLGYNT